MAIEHEEEHNSGEEEFDFDAEFDAEFEDDLDDDPTYTYDRDEVITAVTDYYEFLQRLCLPPDSIKYPPAEGWQYDENTTFSPPKTEQVIDLMKHLPYLRGPSEWDGINMYEKAIAEDYSQFTGETPHDINPWIEYTTLPPHVLMIGQPSGRNGYHVFVDTERGTWTLCDFQVGPGRTTGLSVELEDIENPVTVIEEDGEECTEHWKGFETWTTADFFAKLYKDFADCVIIPSISGTLRFTNDYVEDEAGLCRDIFKQHGWPGKYYRKDECLKALERLIYGNPDED